MENEAVILRRDALREMETGRVFSIQFYTGDLSKQTGGKRITIDRAVMNEPGAAKEPVAGSAAESDKKEQYHSTRAPKHSKNRTRNLRILPSGEIRKIHISLFTVFNGRKVVY